METFATVIIVLTGIFTVLLVSILVMVIIWLGDDK